MLTSQYQMCFFHYPLFCLLVPLTLSDLSSSFDKGLHSFLTF